MNGKLENKFIRCLLALGLVKKIGDESNQSLIYIQQSEIISRLQEEDKL